MDIGTCRLEHSLTVAKWGLVYFERRGVLCADGANC